MATTFQELLRDAARSGVVLRRSADSLKWFREQAKKFRNMTPSQLIREFGKEDFVQINQLSIGKMYFFMYDPKLKKTLPYYDRFPCIFPIERYDDGSILGINLHYLPLDLRAKLMDALFSTENSARHSKNKKLMISYGILKGASKYKYFKPCIKRYLPGHIRSKFLPVPFDAWAVAAFLPVQEFEKKSSVAVWNDSRRIIGK